MRYILGLDVGIASCGWSVVELDGHEKPIRTEDLGVRTFTEADNSERSSKRASRRTLRRKKHRLHRIRNLFVLSGIVDAKVLDKNSEEYLWRSGLEMVDVWELRDSALKRKLTNEEFVRVFMHLAKHRGYKSNRKDHVKAKIVTTNEEGNGRQKKEDEEKRKVLKGVETNEKVVLSGAYRSIGAYFASRGSNGKKRNSKGKYMNSIGRGTLMNEIKLIFSSQRMFGNEFATHELEEQYLQIWDSQRHYSSIELMESMIWDCTFEKGEKRAPKSSYTFSEFTLLQKMFNVRLVEQGSETPLPFDDIKLVVNEVLSLKVPKIKYSDVRKMLDLSKKVRFKGVKKESSLFFDVENLYEIYAVLQSFDHLYTPIDLDTFSYALTICKDDDVLKDYLTHSIIQYNENGRVVSNPHLSKGEYPVDVAEALSIVDCTGFGRLSFKAMKALIGKMYEGIPYDQACKALNYMKNEFYDGTFQFLPKVPETKNPVVSRALSQTRKAINEIIKNYGSPMYIRIELARDMSKSHKEKEYLTRLIGERRSANEEAKKMLIENFGISDPKGKHIIKYKLMIEQGCQCIYSGKSITKDNFEDTEIDHIIPRSLSYDDSFSNKVLVMSSENQNKRNRTPYEYFMQDKPDQLNVFLSRVKNNKKYDSKANNGKRRRLLAESEDEWKGFKNRNLSDTRYITHAIADHIRENLLFSEGENAKKVQVTNGMITAQLRSAFELPKKRDSDLHHAQDATIVAITNESMIQELSRFYKNKNELQIEQDCKIHEPWDGFSMDLRSKMQDMPMSVLSQLGVQDSNSDEASQYIFVSRMPRKNITGKLHDDKRKKGGEIGSHGQLRADIFRKNGKFFLVPVYLIDTINAQPPTLIASRSQTKIFHVDVSYNFVFSLYPDELVRVEKKDGKTFMGYYKTFNKVTATIDIGTHDQKVIASPLTENASGKTFRVPLGNLQSITKMQVDVLGKHFVEIKKEKRSWNVCSKKRRGK